MSLALDAYAARLPELGTSSRHAFLLVEIAAAAARAPFAPGAPYRDATDDADRGGHPHGPRAPLCMALAIDASSSMRGPRFALAVQAARDLVDSLSSTDRVVLVTFERSARVVLGPIATDADGRAHARKVLDRLATGSGTNLAAGWREAAEAMSRFLAPGAARRIVLLTDGHPSQGERDPDALRRIVADGRARGLETSVIGLGDGIDEALCAQLATAGDGRFHYLRTEALLGSAIANEVEGARRLAATEVSLVLAFSQRVGRAEVMHRYPCQPDGRTLEVRVGAVGYNAPRAVLVQLEVEDPSHDAVLGAAVARGRAVAPERRRDMTFDGYALGAASRDGEDEREAASDRVSLSLPAGRGADEARRRIAAEVLTLRTLAEVRAAWDGFDARDHEAVGRRLARAKDLRRALVDAGLVDAAALAALPDVAAIEAAMLGGGAQESREARRTFASWAHNTQSSQVGPMPRKKD